MKLKNTTFTENLKMFANASIFNVMENEVMNLKPNQSNVIDLALVYDDKKFEGSHAQNEGKTKTKKEKQSEKERNKRLALKNFKTDLSNEADARAEVLGIDTTKQTKYNEKAKRQREAYRKHEALDKLEYLSTQRVNQNYEKVEYQVTQDEGEKDEWAINRQPFNKKQFAKKRIKKAIGEAVSRAMMTVVPSEFKCRKSIQNTQNCCKQFTICESGIKYSNYCGSRICPTCNGIRTAHYLHNYSDVMDKVYKDTVFLTLTSKNCTDKELRQNIDNQRDFISKIMKSYNHFIKKDERVLVPLLEKALVDLEIAEKNLSENQTKYLEISEKLEHLEKRSALLFEKYTKKKEKYLANILQCKESVKDNLLLVNKLKSILAYKSEGFDKVIMTISIECTYNAKTNTYHPHFHITSPSIHLVDFILWAWLKNEDIANNAAAQDVVLITNDASRYNYQVKSVYFGKKYSEKQQTKLLNEHKVLIKDCYSNLGNRLKIKDLSRLTEEECKAKIKSIRKEIFKYNSKGTSNVMKYHYEGKKIVGISESKTLSKQLYAECVILEALFKKRTKIFYGLESEFVVNDSEEFILENQNISVSEIQETENEQVETNVSIKTGTYIWNGVHKNWQLTETFWYFPENRIGDISHQIPSDIPDKVFQFVQTLDKFQKRKEKENNESIFVQSEKIWENRDIVSIENKVKFLKLD